MNRKTLESTAHHEAGHAVMAFFQRVAINRVTVKPDPDEGTSGHVSTRPPFRTRTPDKDQSTRARLRMERKVLVSLAGEEAQRRFNSRGVRHHHASTDRHVAINYISYFTGSDRQTEAYYEWLRVTAEEFVGFSAHWYVISALAKELILRTTLSGKEATKFIREKNLEAMKAKPGKGRRRGWKT